MKKLFRATTLALLIYLLFSKQTLAASPYVLPYPSTMPGGVSYKLHLVLEKLMQFWYFGDFGAFEYNLKESDKYLVEAKTLFDYQQYLLAYNALKKSDDYFLKIKPTINKAQRSGKSIVNEQKTFSEAAQKHIEVLSKLESDVPATVVWQPEKQAATNLDLKTAIETSIKIRKNNL